MSHHRKLQLNAQELRVETFDPIPAETDGKGTVVGRDGTTTNTFTSGGDQNCDCQTFAYTCQASCPGSCYLTCTCDVPESEAPTCPNTCYYILTEPFIDSAC